MVIPGIDSWYFILALPGLLLGFWAQATLRSTFGRYAEVPTASGINGQQAAQELLRGLGLNVQMKSTHGQLTDFYNPADKSINLSESSVYNSVASVAVVAHEIGHAQQDAEGYMPMRLRGAIVPAVRLGSWVGPAMFMGGLLLGSPNLALIGVIAFSAAAVFAVVTLPVEYNASSRGLAMLQQFGILQPQEIPGAKKVLSAAALTYLAAALQAIGTVLWYLSLLSRRR
jgi:Zn-dependent membrane protease YugP